MKLILCKECGQEFEPANSLQVLCDDCEQELADAEDDEDA